MTTIDLALFHEDNIVLCLSVGIVIIFSKISLYHHCLLFLFFIQLMEIERMVTESQRLVNNLSQVEEEMNRVSCIVEDQAWQNLIRINEVIRNFQDECFVRKVKMLVNQRRMKRKRVKKRKKLIQLEKKEQIKARQEEEDKIDVWREKLALEEEEKRREKAFKAEADSILGEVRQKQHEALRMQQLLESLITLRLTRINKGAAHGYISSSKNDQHFASTIIMFVAC
nr:programmed cell death protein 7-like isoform X2 [Cherax quadricarinatus]